MQRSELAETLPPEIHGDVARLLREHQVPDEWTAIGFKRDGEQVLVSAATSASEPFFVFAVPLEEWPQVEPWWTQGSVFPT